MQETGRETSCAHELCDFLRYVGDASYAILPEDVAHKLGEIKKIFLEGVRSLIDKEIEWTEGRVAGGDRLRQEWRRACRRDESSAGGGI